MTAPGTTTSPVSDEEHLDDPPWVVIVWDDPVNLMDYVVLVFQTVLGFDRAEATRRMLQVHNEGKATVFSGRREHAEFNAGRLHSYGLWATIEQ